MKWKTYIYIYVAWPKKKEDSCKKSWHSVKVCLTVIIRLTDKQTKCWALYLKPRRCFARAINETKQVYSMHECALFSYSVYSLHRSMANGSGQDKEKITPSLPPYSIIQNFSRNWEVTQYNYCRASHWLLQ